MLRQKNERVAHIESDVPMDRNTYVTALMNGFFTKHCWREKNKKKIEKKNKEKNEKKNEMKIEKKNEGKNENKNKEENESNN